MSIRIENLSCQIGSNKILTNVSALVKDKKWVGIIGPNGSGKTTLLKHVYRSLPTTKNTIYINSKAIEELSYKDSAKYITVVKQETSSDFNFKVKDMVLLGRSPYKKTFENYNKEDLDIANEALLSIGMLDYIDRDFATLSGGEKQRVLIARSLTQQCETFVLDEPTNHLDIYYQWSLMQTIKERDATVLGVFHELGLASHFCDYLYVLDKGEVVYSGTPKEVMTKEMLANVFKVDADIIDDGTEKPRILINGAISQ